MTTYTFGTAASDRPVPVSIASTSAAVRSRRTLVNTAVQQTSRLNVCSRAVTLARWRRFIFILAVVLRLWTCSQHTHTPPRISGIFCSTVDSDSLQEAAPICDSNYQVLQTNSTPRCFQPVTTLWYRKRTFKMTKSAKIRKRVWGSTTGRLKIWTDKMITHHRMFLTVKLLSCGQ